MSNIPPSARGAFLPSPLASKPSRLRPSAAAPYPGSARRWLLVAALATSLPGSAFAAKKLETEFNLETATLQEVQLAMDSGALTSVELVNIYLRRIAIYDQNGAPFFNSVLHISPDVLEQAREADRLRASGTKLGPLHGIPCLVKGSYSVKGLPTSAGTTAWADLIAPEDCFLVGKLREAGAIIMGQANMDTWANSGQSSTSQIKGAVKNAYVLGTTAGGSSGGSAVATAANFAFFAFGGETGASIRGPSDRNGLAGQRPTAGALPSNHIVNLSPERDVVGPMARNVGDIAAIRDAVSFQDPEDPWAPILPLFTDGRPFPQGFNKAIETATLSGKKLGIIGTYVGLTHPEPGEGATSATTDIMTTRPEVFANLEASKTLMEGAGATVRTVFLPPAVSTTYDRGAEAPQRVLSSQPISGRFNAYAHRGMVEFLVRTPGDTTDTLAAKVIAKAALPTGNTGSRTINDTTIGYMYTFGENSVVTGSEALSFASDEAEEHYTAVREIRRKLEAWMDAEDLDALVFPVDSGKTATVGSVNGRDPINAMHIPGTVVPNGSLPDGEPTCLIFVGKGYEDVEVFKLAYAFEQVSKKRYSTPLAPALPEESFTYAVKVKKGKPSGGPIITLAGVPKKVGTGAEATLDIRGKIVKAADLDFVSVFLNGKRIPVSLTKAENNKSWTASMPLSSALAAADGSPRVMLTVEATDADGDTDIKMKAIKLKPVVN
ncbi:amidase [Luteolibacter sp. Populi]|uniref:amidase n=1 Tax=Luteolibacter sp. Populi TaxID=3230487 RepID=UPI0034673351